MVATLSDDKDLLKERGIGQDTGGRREIGDCGVEGVERERLGRSGVRVRRTGDRGVDCHHDTN